MAKPKGRWVTVRGHAVYIAETRGGTVVAKPSGRRVGPDLSLGPASSSGDPSGQRGSASVTASSEAAARKLVAQRRQGRKITRVQVLASTRDGHVYTVHYIDE